MNGVRNCLGFTGTWKGARVSVQATGMGQPSMAIYAQELFDDYDVRTIIRVGTCGALADGLALGSLLVADGVLAEDGTSRALGSTGTLRGRTACARRSRTRPTAM